jgi:mannose-6-phosphate isomerase-like protein (cupin superfamily)
MKPIMNLDEVAFDDIEDNGYYTSKRGRISDHIGAKKLGYSLTLLPPGKAQCPFHNHHGEEFLILEGHGGLRFGNQRFPIRPHDVTGTAMLIPSSDRRRIADGRVCDLCALHPMKPRASLRCPDPATRGASAT